MSVEFLIKNNGVEVSINHKDFTLLEPAFQFLKSKTGLFIDEYADGRISPDHAKLLYQFIAENINTGNGSKLDEFKELLSSSFNQNLWIEYIGD